MAGDDVLIRVDNVGKKFCRDLRQSLVYGVRDVIGEFLPGQHNTTQLRKGEFWANKGISFEVRRGECLGLIGHNGAGKTTLLKMLNGLIKPDEGSIEMRGRVGALIALGAGFNPVLTARENVYIAGTVLGLAKKEIDQKYDGIVEFSGLEEFMETPVRNFSSGMQVRLGFAVATCIEPDILLIDEVLAVGDASFRALCYQRIGRLSNDAAIIFVSHSLPYVSRVCTSCLVLDKGSAYHHSSTLLAITKYQSLVSILGGEGDRFGTGDVRVEAVEFSTEGEVGIYFGESISIFLTLRILKPVPRLIIDLAFKRLDGTPVAECQTLLTNFTTCSQSVDVSVRIETLLLNPGRYQLCVYVTDEKMATHYDWWESAKTFEVGGPFRGTCDVQFKGVWKTNGYVESRDRSMYKEISAPS